MSEVVTLEDFPTMRFIVWQDEDAPEPISDSGCPVECLAYREGYQSIASDNTGKYIDVFKQFYNALGDAEKALRAMKYWLVRFNGWTPEEAEARTLLYSHLGYSQGDWLDMFFIVTEDGYGTPEGWANEWSRWANGDVYVVRAETKIECENLDLCHLDEDDHWTMQNDQGVEHMTCGGYYADSPEEAARLHANDL